MLFFSVILVQVSVYRSFWIPFSDAPVVMKNVFFFSPFVLSGVLTRALPLSLLVLMIRVSPLVSGFASKRE